MRALPRLLAAALAATVTAGMSVHAQPALPDGRPADDGRHRGNDRIVDGYFTDYLGIGAAALDAFEDAR